MAVLCRVLVAEDELIIRQGIKHLIDWEANGFEIVVETQNGRDALEQAQALNPHIVITDVVMPIMNGVELIKELHEFNPDIQIVVLSGYDNFEYVRAALRYGASDYILKPTINHDELLAAMRTAAAKIPGFALCAEGGVSPTATKLSRVLSGYASAEVLEEIRDLFQLKYLTLFGMNIPYALGTAANASVQTELLDQAVGKYLSDMTHFRLIVEGEILLLIINHAEEDVSERLKQVAAYFVKREPNAFYVCSKSFSGVERLRAVFESDFSTYTRNRFYHKGKPFVHVRDFESRMNQQPPDFGDLSPLLVSKNISQAIDLLRDNISCVLREQSMDEPLLKSVTENAVFNILVALEEIGMPREAVKELKRSYFKYRAVTVFADDFADVMTAILDELARYAVKYQKDRSSSAISQIVDYINANYAGDLKLADIARRFNFNYNYLSSYFMANNAEGFNKYLNNVRIDKSKELLLDPGIPVSEVGIRVGFMDQSYFARVFKARAGLTPSAFRAKYTRSAARLQKKSE